MTTKSSNVLSRFNIDKVNAVVWHIRSGIYHSREVLTIQQLLKYGTAFTPGLMELLK